MCGICGVFEYLTGRTVSQKQLQRMNDTLRHRGPDDEGFYIVPGIGLAARRLSIIDVYGGHQPIANEDESCWIVFNGEIYNYQALQKRVIERGHQLRTRSDTEVILHLYEDYGMDCVHHLDGMFAFAIYDCRDQTMDKGSSFRVNRSSSPARLFLARDRLGKKPLYYADVNGCLVFGSELKPLLQDPRISRDLDFEALHHYLSLLMVPAPYSIFKAIRKLPPGHILECDVDGTRVRRYWNYLDHVNDHAISEEEALAQIRHLLFAAVEKRLIAEVPLGAFLSGGLDSSTVVAIMSRFKSEPIKTFAIGFEGPATHNELPYARALAEHYRTDHHEYLVKADIVELLPQIVRFADEPFAISSAIPTFLLAHAARQEVAVVLTGDGGDENFGGYPQYLYERWSGIYRRFPAFVDPFISWIASALERQPNHFARTLGRRGLKFVTSSRLSLGDRRLRWASGWSEPQKQSIYTSEVRSAIQTTTSAFFLESQVSALKSPLAQQFGMDALIWLPDEMLTKVDRMTMAASIEARCPLLDVSLVEYMAGFSAAMKIPGLGFGSLKHLLRRSVIDLIPPQLLKRHKHGFIVPLDTWFRTEARPFIDEVLEPGRVRRRGIFNPTTVTNLIQHHSSGQVNASSRIYALLVFEIWATEYLS